MEIEHGSIHLWLANNEEINNPFLLKKYFSILSPEEKKKYNRFYFPKDRHQYLITRALIRCVLSMYIDDINPKSWKFSYGEYGKPTISNTACLPLEFNITHTEKLVILAVSLGHQIGIDAEWILRNNHTENIANHCFSEIEIDNLKLLSESKKIDRFYDIWTLKEAYIKACGNGLSMPLNHFSFQFDHNGEIEVLFHHPLIDESSDWIFFQLQFSSEHKISLAIKDPYKKINRPEITREIVPFQGFKKIHLQKTLYSKSAKRLCH